MLRSTSFAARCVGSRGAAGSLAVLPAVATAPSRSTTVLCIQREGKAVIVADGQVTLGDVVFKSNVRKVRRLGGEKGVIAGFAGSTADALTLFERLENRLEEFPGQLTRAATSLARDWRTDKFLRRLEATMVVSDGEVAYSISGAGDVIQPEGGVIGIGSGGFYALSAARALMEVEGMEIDDIARRSMKVAGDLCIYTNHNIIEEHYPAPEAEDEESEAGDKKAAKKSAKKASIPTEK